MYNNKGNKSLDTAIDARINAQVEYSKVTATFMDEINDMKKELKKQRLKNVRKWYEIEYKEILEGKRTFDDIPASRKEAYDEFPEVIHTITSILDTHYKASKREEEYIQI